MNSLIHVDIVFTNGGVGPNDGQLADLLLEQFEDALMVGFPLQEIECHLLEVHSQFQRIEIGQDEDGGYVIACQPLTRH